MCMVELEKQIHLLGISTTEKVGKKIGIVMSLLNLFYFIFTDLQIKALD